MDHGTKKGIHLSIQTVAYGVATWGVRAAFKPTLLTPATLSLILSAQRRALTTLPSSSSHSSGLVCWRLLPETLDHRTKKGIHLTIQTVAYGMATWGVRAAFKFHNEHQPPIANMYSLHSWLGIAVVVLWGLQVRVLPLLFTFLVVALRKGPSLCVGVCDSPSLPLSGSVPHVGVEGGVQDPQRAPSLPLPTCTRCTRGWESQSCSCGACR